MCNPDTDRHPANLREGLSRDLAPQPFGQMGGFGHVAMRYQHREFLAAPARQQVGRAQIVLDQLRKPDQNLITHLMAVAVVDRLEVVDIEEQQGERRFVAVCPRDFSRSDLLEMPPVPGAGQDIRRREQAQFDIGGL